MTGIFRLKNSSNALVLLVYALVLKFHIFLHPQLPVKQPDDNYLYTGLLDFLEPLQLPPLFFSFVSFLLIYSQASLLNRICSSQKLLPKQNYLPAMAYVLITSLLPDWNYFSAPLLINSLLIWIYYRMILLYNSNSAAAGIFNIGLMIGLVTLFYKPAVVFALLIWLALFIMRPFIVREWLIGLLGLTTPYYFLIILLYLTNNWSWQKIIPSIRFALPAMPSSVLTTISIALLIIPFIIGGVYVQNNLSKMLIQVRKNWSLLLLFLIVSTLIILISGGSNYSNWLLCALPITVFHAALYYYAGNRVFPLVVHWILFFYTFYLNYWL